MQQKRRETLNSTSPQSRNQLSFSVASHKPTKEATQQNSHRHSNGQPSRHTAATSPRADNATQPLKSKENRLSKHTLRNNYFRITQNNISIISNITTTTQHCMIERSEKASNNKMTAFHSLFLTNQTKLIKTNSGPQPLNIKAVRSEHMCCPPLLSLHPTCHSACQSSL